MKINSMNVMNAHNHMVNNQKRVSQSMERLSSGLRINKASDDPSGLAMSEKMRSKIRGLEQGTRNAQDGISMLQTAEGGLQVGQDILQRMNELANQATSTTLGAEDRKMVEKEVRSLLDELDKMSGKSEFNGHKLLDGTLDMKIAIDADGGPVNVLGGSMKTADLGGTNKLSSFNEAGANELLTSENALLLKKATEEAINDLSSQRSSIGIKQNQLERTINYNQTASENLQAAESRIRDVDIAKEMMTMTKHQVVAEASQAMFSQAQHNSYKVLELLR